MSFFTSNYSVTPPISFKSAYPVNSYLTLRALKNLSLIAIALGLALNTSFAEEKYETYDTYVDLKNPNFSAENGDTLTVTFKNGANLDNTNHWNAIFEASEDSTLNLAIENNSTVTITSTDKTFWTDGSYSKINVLGDGKIDIKFGQTYATYWDDDGAIFDSKLNFSAESLKIEGLEGSYGGNVAHSIDDDMEFNLQELEISGVASGFLFEPGYPQSDETGEGIPNTTSLKITTQNDLSISTSFEASREIGENEGVLYSCALYGQGYVHPKAFLTMDLSSKKGSIKITAPGNPIASFGNSKVSLTAEESINITNTGEWREFAIQANGHEEWADNEITLTANKSITVSSTGCAIRQNLSNAVLKSSDIITINSGTSGLWQDLSTALLESSNSITFNSGSTGLKQKQSIATLISSSSITINSEWAVYSLDKSEATLSAPTIALLVTDFGVDARNQSVVSLDGDNISIQGTNKGISGKDNSSVKVTGNHLTIDGYVRALDGSSVIVDSKNNVQSSILTVKNNSDSNATVHAYNNDLTNDEAIVTINTNAVIQNGSDSSYNMDRENTLVALETYEGGKVLLNNPEARYQVFGDIRSNSDTVTDAEIQISGKDSILVGDVYALNKGQVQIALNGQNASLTGLANNFADETQWDTENSILGKGTLNINLTNNAKWNIPSDSWLDKFEIRNNAIADFAYSEGKAARTQTNGSPYVTVQAAEFISDSGTLLMRADIDQQSNDQLLVSDSSSGNVIIDVKAVQNAGDHTRSGDLIIANNSTLKAELPLRTFEYNGQPIEGRFTEAGVYLYQLQSDQKDDGKQYTYLVRVDKKTPTADAVLAMAGMAGQNALYYSQLSDLRKRLGEVRLDAKEGLWASIGAQKDRITGFSNTGYKQTLYRFNFGYDKKVNEHWLLGANFKYAQGNQKVRDSYNNAKGDTHSEGLNLYAVWTKENGCYADLVLSADKYHQKLNTKMLSGENVRGRLRNWGLGASIEIGRKILYGEDKDWFLEPQAQLSFYHVKGDKTQMSNGVKVKQKDFNALTGRLGVVAGKDFVSDNPEKKTQFFLKAGVKQEFLANQTIWINDVRFKDSLRGTGVYYGLGADWQPKKNLKFFAHIEREHGSHYTKEIEASVGMKYQF